MGGRECFCQQNVVSLLPQPPLELILILWRTSQNPLRGQHQAYFLPGFFKILPSTTEVLSSHHCTELIKKALGFKYSLSIRQQVKTWKMPGPVCSVWLWEGCLRPTTAPSLRPPKDRSRCSRTAGGGMALKRDLSVVAASPDTELEGRHRGKFIDWVASAIGRGSRGAGGSQSLASPPASRFRRAPFVPAEVIFLREIIYEWKMVRSRRTTPTHTQIFPSHSNL